MSVIFLLSKQLRLERFPEFIPLESAALHPHVFILMSSTADASTARIVVTHPPYRPPEFTPPERTALTRSEINERIMAGTAHPDFKATARRGSGSHSNRPFNRL